MITNYRVYDSNFGLLRQEFKFYKRGVDSTYILYVYSDIYSRLHYSISNAVEDPERFFEMQFRFLTRGKITSIANAFWPNNEEIKSIFKNLVNEWFDGEEK